MPVKELQSENNFRRIESGSRLVELSGPLNLEHKIASIDVLHHEKETILSLKYFCFKD